METSYKDELIGELRERKTRNSSYSLRAYSRDLGVSLTALSDVMSGKREFSLKNAERVAEVLCFSPKQKQQMLLALKGQMTGLEKPQKIRRIEQDEFQLLSNWFYLAILTLSSQGSVSAKPQKIAERLGISSNDVKEAVTVLKRLKLLTVQKGMLVRTSLPLRTTTDVPSYAIRNYHKENLEVCRYALDHVPVELRDVSSMNMNIDPGKIQKAKKMIYEFKEKFTNEMEKSKPKEVYTLAMHFVPASMARREDNE